MTSTEEQGFLEAIKETPGDVTTLLAYADWLEEHSRPYRAMMRRVEAGVSQARFKVCRKTDGLFSEGGERHVKWSATGKEWERLSSVRAGTSPRGRTTPCTATTLPGRKLTLPSTKSGCSSSRR